MDEALKASLKQAIHTWINGRQQALLEQVMMTWQEGLGRFKPDEDLLEQLAALAPPPPEPLEAPVDTERELAAALELLEQAASQGDVLKRLLEGLQPFVERSALFVVKQGIATLYAARGFEPDPPRLGAPVVPPPDLEAVVNGRQKGLAQAGPGYQALLVPLSRFEAQDLRILPIHLRRKVVALLLVDSGLLQVLDHPAHVRALCRAAEAALSYLAGQKEEEQQPKAAPAPEPPPSMPTQRIPEPIPEPAQPALDPKIRANAERSARVLVGDIELYFPAKVEQARQQGNLYGLLRDELDRSRASFVDRYGADVEAQHRIFQQTVVAQLCGGDPAKLGNPSWM